MSQKTLIALALLVGGLLAFIWFVERDLPSSDERAESANRLLTLGAEEVQSITLEVAQSTVHFERAKVSATKESGEPIEDDLEVAPDWFLIHPFNSEGDQSSINQFVDSLLALEKKRTLEGVDPATLGLETPRAVVRLKTTSGDKTLLVGSEVPASSTMIVQLEGQEKYFVVADSIWASISKQAGDWRSRKLFKGSRDAIERISMTSNGQRLLLAKRGNRFWIETPIVDRADATAIGKLLTAVAGLQVEEFIDEPGSDLETMGLNPATVILDVVTAGQLSPLRLNIGGPSGAGDETFYAQSSDQVVTIKNGLTELMIRSVEDWQDRSLASMKSYEIDRVLVTGVAGDMVLERMDGNWSRDDDQIDFSLVNNFLSSVSDLEATEIVGQGVELKVAPESEVLKLELAGGQAEESLSFHSDETAEIWAVVSGRDVSFHLDSVAFADLQKQLTEVRSASPIEVDEPEAMESGDPENS